MIIVDSDFLSSLLKINRLDIVKDFFKEDIYIPIAVQREIAKTDLIQKLNEKNYVNIVFVKKVITDFEILGKGEAECLSLAKENDLVLMNDKFASKIAEDNKLKTLNITGFLLALKETSFISKEILNRIVKDLKKKDFYSFSKKR